MLIISPVQDCDRNSRRVFLKRLGLVLSLLIPVLWISTPLTTTIHEVVGHGLTTICLGGTFTGFQVDLDGSGYAYVTLPSDAPAWKEIVQTAGGSVVDLVVGAMILLSAVQIRNVLISLPMLVIGLDFLISVSVYVFWDAVWYEGAGDITFILRMVDTPWLRPILIAVACMILCASIWIGTAMVFRRLEQCLNDEGRLTGLRRITVLTALGVVPAATWFIYDWNQIIPGVGYWPNVVCASLHIFSAISVYWLRFKPQPAQLSSRATGIAVAAAWVMAILSTLVTACWLRYDVSFS